MGLFDDLIPEQANSKFGGAISNIESGGNYKAVGPQTGKGRALGKYQVMDFNVGPWTKEALGREMNPMEFLGSPDAQEAVFNHKFGQYAQKYGPEGAARAWFAGEGGMNNPNARDILGTTVKDYSAKFTKGLPAGAMSFAQEQPEQASPLSFDDLIPQKPAAPTFDERFQEPSAPPDAAALKPALEGRARAMTQGPAVSPGQTMLADFGNLLPAAEQRTTPNIGAQAPNLVSTDVFQNDAGMAMFRDPSTGQMVEADQAKHVVLRDPSDNKLKVFARSEATNEMGVTGAARVLAPGLASGAPTARASIPTRSPRAIQAPSREQLFDAADAGYESARGLGVQFDKTRVGDIAFELRGTLMNDGLDPITAKNTHAILDRLTSAADKSPVNASFNDLESTRRALGKVAGGGSSPDGLVRSDAAAASRAIEAIDNFFSAPGGAAVAGNADELARVAKDARGNYAAGAKSARIGRAEELAELQAATGGSGANIDNAMRQRAKDILKNPKELRGWSKEEIVELRKVAVGTPIRNVSRLLGKLAPTGVVSAGLSGGGGLVIGGGVGAVAVPATGFVFKKLGDVLTARQFNKLDEIVRSNSPLGRQMQASLDDWSGKLDDLVKTPGAPRMAQFVLATRNFSNNLRDVGISLSPSEIIKSVQGTIKGGASDENPEPERVLND